jgi:hypothetical protein
MMNSELPPNERPQQQPQPQSSPISGTMVGGVVLVIIGGVFLLQTMGLMDRFGFDFNWWALFMLIPIFSIGNSAWQTYQANGQQLTREVRSKFVIVAGMLIVCAALMFELNWGQLWPVFLILGGLGLLFGGSASR